jgi:hypothetical protein
MADMIEFEIDLLSRLTTRLLRTARLDQEELKPRLKPMDIALVVERSEPLHGLFSRVPRCS